MLNLAQSPIEPAFVQNPYPFYERVGAGGPLFLWEDCGLVCATYATVVGASLEAADFGPIISALETA